MWAFCDVCIVELVVRIIITALVVVLVVESYDINDRLGMPFLLLFGDAVGL